MNDREKIIVLAAAVAGLLAERGEESVRLGRDGCIVGIDGGDVHIDGLVVARKIVPAAVCEI